MYPVEKPIIVGVAPGSEANRHWIYYDDGMVVEFDPTTGRVHAVSRVPDDPRKSLANGAAPPG